MVSSSIKLEAFRELIEQKQSLLSDHWPALTALAGELSDLSDNNDESAAKVEAWLQEKDRSAILAAYKKILKDREVESMVNPREILGFGGKSPTKPNQPSQSLPESIEQAVKANSPIAKQEKEKPEKS